MKRAMTVIVNEEYNEVDITELNPDLEYRIKYLDGEWVASIEPNCEVGDTE